MDESLALTLLTLASVRLSMMLAYDVGPLNAIERLRQGADRLATNTQHLRLVGYVAKNFQQGLACTWCNSVWVGAIWGGAYLLWPEIAPLVAFPFAVSAIAMIWQRHFS